MSVEPDVGAESLLEFAEPEGGSKPGKRWRFHRQDSPADVAARRHKRIIRAIQLALVIAALVVWQRIGGSSKANELTISTPTSVLAWMGRWAMNEEANGWSDLWATLQEAALGWVLGGVIGIGLAIVVMSTKWTRAFAPPFVSMLNALPKVALAPLFILIWGTTLESKVYFVTTIVLFISFYNVVGGIRSIDPLYLRNCRILGASRLWLIRDVYVPAIVGWLMTSLRLSAGWALAGAVIAEYLGSLKGMGYVVLQGQDSQSPEQVVGGILIVSIAALIVDRILLRIEAHFRSWRL